MIRRLALLALAAPAILSCGDSAPSREWSPPDVPDTAPQFIEEICTDGIDNDRDGRADCRDTECINLAVCQPPVEICGDDIDNDFNGRTDCEDERCYCTEDEFRDDACDDGIDNDGDGAVDCGDLDCDCAPDEVCDDAVDNDLDELTDCDDPDCDCPRENTESLCTDGVDNDGDCAIDCEDSDCAAWFCGCPEIRGGMCVEEFDWRFGDRVSYIRGLRIAAPDEEACCFDFDDDGDLDNGLGTLAARLLTLDPAIDLNALLQEAIEDDALSLLLEWDRNEGEGLWLWHATNDLSGNGTPEHRYGRRADGGGAFGIPRESFDNFGAFTQFMVSLDEDGLTWAGPSYAPLLTEDGTPRWIDDDCYEPRSFGLEQLTLVGEVVEFETGLGSEDHSIEVDGEVHTVGGWSAGGVIRLEPFGELLDYYLRTCPCSAADWEFPAVVGGDDGTDFEMTCSQNVGSECSAEEDGEICGRLELFCELLPELTAPAVRDVDTDGNGVNDAISFGFHVSAVGTTFAEPVILD